VQPPLQLHLAASRDNAVQHAVSFGRNLKRQLLPAVVEASTLSTATCIKGFSFIMPQPNVAFLRAFSVQLLRALGYCHGARR
jgi:hypothetical protein